MELAYYGGRPVAALGLGDGDVGDLLAYRSAWEPYVAAHLELWRKVNEALESTTIAKNVCPPGIFDPSQIKGTEVEAAFCGHLLISRIRISSTNPGGILTQWNAWQGKSAADMAAGARTMLEWHQRTVLEIGGPMKDQIVRIAELWKIPIQLPDVPPFSLQQQIIARIEGAFIQAKGALKIIGYAAGETLKVAGSTGEALAEGLSDTARAIPKVAASPFVWIGVAAVVAIVGGALIVYYVPRRAPQPALPA